jgi:hypothetical protein
LPNENERMFSFAASGATFSTVMTISASNLISMRTRDSSKGIADGREPVGQRRRAGL